jgi:pimeloyl-ACP methyl ester carboxylesterase
VSARSEGRHPVREGELFYEIEGEGPVVTLIHPGLWDSRTWDPQVSALVAGGYRALRYDVRGYGRSSRLTGPPYSHVHDLAELMSGLGVERSALVGCSMGGEIAIDFTLSHPQRVDALLLAASGLGGYEGTSEENAWWERTFAEVDAAIEAGDHERAEDLRLAIWAPLGTGDASGRRIREIAFDNIHELTMDESGAEELDPPAMQRLQEISVPTLVIDAADDVPIMHSIADILAGEIPGARKVVIENADHVVNLRQPEAFNGYVLGFLREHLRA